MIPPNPTPNFLKLTAPGIPALAPYLPGKPISELERELGINNSIKLASNENPLGPSPKVPAAISAHLQELARYPDGNGFNLRHALAHKHQVTPECITLGNGSNDVLDIIARTFLYPGAEAIFSQYAFAVYPICTQAVGAKSQIAPACNYGHDLTAMARLVNPNTRVIFIANPNNPTGTWVTTQALKDFLNSLPTHVIVVIDEAYFEYVTNTEYPDTSLWLTALPNLIVTRTFSKAYGLAGLRIGYSLSHPQIANLLNRVRQPFNVNSLALIAAEVALSDHQHLQQVTNLNTQELALLSTGITNLGLSYIPSVANFITIDLARSAAPIYQALLKTGCIARPLAVYDMPNHLRVTVGLPEENARFLQALSQVLAQL
ncbi:aspartate aminotransferase [Achromatium sp. WMS2]|nr:aspartate aminotransferase [Achromatium sp. WMS2]